jgi:NAD+ kinase|tara:strand:+ start:652 stop:1509 length:858 start_codon:yes stop_codon:yes gene_type:complete
MTAPRNRILIVANLTKPNAESIAKELYDVALANGCSAEITTTFPLESCALAGKDLCIVIGGDGSILGVVGAVAETPVPVMGVNLGTLGFMANYSPEGAIEALKAFLKTPHPPSNRKLIKVTTAKGRTTWALNDVVIRATGSRLARLTVRADDNYLSAFYADGLIFATPTGSTAYSLSAGGPLLHPEARVLAMTPINPHSLTSRAMVLPEEVELTIELDPITTDIQISTDGRRIEELESVFPIKVHICPNRYFPLLQPPNTSLYDLLRQKLRWMGEIPSRLQSDES